jgi:hypothetical protein
LKVFQELWRNFSQNEKMILFEGDVIRPGGERGPVEVDVLLHDPVHLFLVFESVGFDIRPEKIKIVDKRKI